MKKISPMSYIYKTEIPEADWEKTTACVKARMGEMKQLKRRMGKSKGRVRSQTAGTKAKN